MKKRDFNAALSCYSRAVELCETLADINKPDHLTKKGKCLMFLAENNEAIKCFDEVIQLKPSDSTAYHSKGLCLQYLQKYTEAIKCFDHAIKVIIFKY